MTGTDYPAVTSLTKLFGRLGRPMTPIERQNQALLLRWIRALDLGRVLPLHPDGYRLQGSRRFPCPDGGGSNHGNYCRHEGPHVYHGTNHDLRQW